MKKRFLSLLPYLAVLAAVFYLLPLLMQDTGSAMFLMLCVMPLAAFLTGAVHGLRRGFSLLPLAALLLFLPTIFLFYNSSAWVYAPAYALIVLAGNGAGKLFRGKR